ncbi:MAG: hypothetical protein N3G74_00775 [Candidatus Micrarchaeota archaeon]|nr:hypothetical protein [Candidatus Micrarchaeota archaeon]
MAIRKGQAAMEYLMTYGWAILIVLAIMGILVYLVRPQQVETCQVTTPFQCEQDKYTINSSNFVKISLRNLGAVAYNISSVQCGTKVDPAGVIITPGSSGVLTFNCASSSSALQSPQPGKDTFKDKLIIKYYPVGSPEFIKTQEIEIVVRYS